jgi:ATPase family AAA domain-containing protein 3A/B
MFNFGNKKKADATPTPAPEGGDVDGPITPLSSSAGGVAAGGKPDGGKSGAYAFDSSALERAAKAAKELEKNKNANQIIDLTKTQEVTKQKQAEADRAKFSAYQQELAIKRAQEEEQIAQRTMQKQTEQEKLRADYRDQLERQKIIDQINAQRQLADEERQKAEESTRRMEELKKKTLEYESELRQQTEMAKVKAETEGRIMQERKNHDLLRDKIKLEQEEQRTTYMEGLKLSLKSIGEGLTEFSTNKEKLTNVGTFLAGTAIAIYGGRAVIGVTSRIVEARIGKPSLIRETSRGFKSMIGLGSSSTDALANVVLENNLSERLKRIAVSAANTKSNRAAFRHLLLFGPPGTGKTMFAKGLAQRSGMDYAIMTGGDIAPLGKDGVTEIHKLFDWANASKKGVVIFVDEADAFLRKRSTEKISEDMRNALNAFLYRTGESSKKFMIVYASNQPEQFDWAINDRIDEMVEFTLPGTEERFRMIKQYIDQMLKNVSDGGKPITLGEFDDNLIHDIVKQTKGYSGREINKLVIAWQSAAYGNANAFIDEAMMRKVLAESKESKRQKQSWLSKEEIANMTRDSSR